MKCLTPIEARRWLAAIGIAIAEDLTIDFGDRTKRNKHSVQRRFRKGDVNLWRLSEATIGWLPKSSERMLWFSGWDTYPVGQVNFIEKVRLGCGESRNLFQTPGHLFEPTSYSDYDDRSPKEVDEEAIMAGLVLLVLSLDWDAALFSKESSDYVFISDGYTLFSSEDAERAALAPA
jgi:hypothetical protein